MICREVEVLKAAGFRSLNNIRLKKSTLYKGRIISEDDVAALHAMGVGKIFVVEHEDGEIEHKTAQEVVVNKLSGKDIAYVIGEDGLAKVFAAEDGFFIVDEGRVEKFNKLNSEIILNTVPAYSFVTSGEVVAEVSFSAPLFSSEKIDKMVFGLSANADLLSISQVLPKRVAVLYAKFYNDKKEEEHFSKSLFKLIDKTKNLDLNFVKEYFADYNLNSIADRIEDALDDANDILFIVPPFESSGLDDVISKSISSVAENVVNSKIFSVNAPELIVAARGNGKIIGLPFSYPNVDLEMMDEIILKSIVSEKILATDFVSNKVDTAILHKKATKQELDKFIYSSKKDSKKISIASVILAGGVGSRVGNGVNKLLIEIDGEPLFMKSVKEAIKADIGPVFVVTGFMGEDIEKSLDGLDVKIIHNISYRDGVKNSIKLAMKHIPGACDGVLLFLGDMPNITSHHIDKLVKKIDRRKSRQLIVTSFEGVKYNPTLWGKSLLDLAEIVPEGSNLRPVLVNYEDCTDLVEVDSVEELLDVNYPADIERCKKTT